MTNRIVDADFQQFTGAFDAPVSPSPAFAARLSALVTSQAGTQPPVVPGALPRGVTMPPVPAAISAPRQPRHWRRGLEAAVAAVLVLSLIGAAMLFTQPDRLTDLAFQPDQANEVNFGGDAGRSWVLGGTVPEMGQLRHETVPGIVENPDSTLFPYRSLIVGDSVVYVMAQGDRYFLVRYDLESQKQVWAIETFITGSLASDGKLLYAVRYMPKMSAEGPESAARLTAFSLESGKTAWEGPELATRSYSANSVALVDNVVFATDYLGNVLAVNKADGSTLWQYPEEFAAPPANEEYIVDQAFVAPPDIAVSGTAVFVGQPSNTVLKLDRATGEVMGSINLVDRYGADIVHPVIQATEDTLVVTAIRAGRQTSSASDEPYNPATLMVFDAETLDLRTSSDIAAFKGNVVIDGDAIFVAAPATPYADANLYRVDLDTGDLGSPLGHVAAREGILLSASGGVLMATGDPSTVTFFDIESGEEIWEVELGISNTEIPSSMPVPMWIMPAQMWGANPIVITGMGDVYVIEDATG